MEVKDIESQLHEQYAINNNSKLGTVVTFIVAMFAVFGAYGYVYFYTSPELPSRFELLTNDTPYKFTIWGTLFAAFAVYFVFLIIFYICVHQGMAQRKDQFITFAIRYKAYKKNLYAFVCGAEDCKKDVEYYLWYDYKKIFPKDYHPFKKGYQEFIQGLYGEFVKIIYVCSFFIIPISIVIKIFTSDICDPNSCIISVMLLISTILFPISFFWGIIVYLFKYECFFLFSPVSVVLKVFSIDLCENYCYNIIVPINLLLIGCFYGIIILYVLIINRYYEKYKKINNEYVEKLGFDSSLKE